MTHGTSTPALSRNSIRTLYLLPHSHTDVGYSHDPVITLELHDRFLDRAIALCERTRKNPDGARFRWTVEVFSSLLHWWENRSPADHARLRACMDRGEIDVGARYLNGTELYSPGDVAWELAELERVARLMGHRPSTAIQNDVNGFPLAFAERMPAAGVETLVMGLNTTMGYSPFPRCSAFRWDVGNGGEILVWNGWIYNRIKTFCHLDRLATDLSGARDAMLASLPADYPYDFAMTSATIGDNIGPFPDLPEQVRLFNERSQDFKLCLGTFTDFSRVLAPFREQLPVFTGHWPDFWTFGAGSMPQMVASVRRAQRRLRLVERFRALGWADESGGTLTLQRARRALAYACEHTYDSHTSSGESSGSADSMRQKAQIQVDAAVGESASMVLLRDHLAALSIGVASEPVSVLAVNPHPWPLTFDYLSERKGLMAFASSRQPEHFFQFDREPTFEALAAAGSFGVRDVRVGGMERMLVPLVDLDRPTHEALSMDAPIEIRAGNATLSLASPTGRTPSSTPRFSWRLADGVERFDTGGVFPTFSLVEERPLTPFQSSNAAAFEMDPTDCAWNPDLRFERRILTGSPAAISRSDSGARRSLDIEYSEAGPLRRMTFSLDDRAPSRLWVTADFRFDADPTRRAYYLTLSPELPGANECEYWVDGCGVWFGAGRHQLPNTCTSFYQAYRGVAVSRDEKTLYILSPDSTLFQCGDFTFGRLPCSTLQRQRPFVALWVYNNYWGTNFPSYSPGLLTTRFLLAYRSEPFDPGAAERLDALFDVDYLTHPLSFPVGCRV